MPRPWFTTTEVEPLGESDLPQAATILGAISAVMSSGVWLYIGYHVLRRSAENHNIASIIKILGAVGLLGGFPGALALLLGAGCLLQRRASRAFRRRSVVAIGLGMAGLAGAVAIQVAANVAH